MIDGSHISLILTFFRFIEELIEKSCLYSCTTLYLLKRKKEYAGMTLSVIEINERGVAHLFNVIKVLK
jgi:DNA gyrase/topoisomerase IV subunit B